MEPETDVFSLLTIQRVIDYIEENLTEEITIADIAEQFYVSVSSISLILNILRLRAKLLAFT